MFNVHHVSSSVAASPVISLGLSTTHPSSHHLSWKLSLSVPHLDLLTSSL